MNMQRVAIYANILSFVNDYPDQWNEVAKYAKLAIEGGSLMSEKELLSGFNDLSLSEVLWGLILMVKQIHSTLHS